MKKSLNLLFATIILGAVFATASISQSQPMHAGGDPVPLCPPSGCDIEK